MTTIIRHGHGHGIAKAGTSSLAGALQLSGEVIEELPDFVKEVYSLYTTPLEVYNSLPGKDVLTEMQAGHGFNTNAGGTHEYNSTRYPIIGTQHFWAETNGAQGYKYCQDIPLASTFDFTGKNLSILMRIDNLPELNEFQLFLGNGGGLSISRKYSNLEGSQTTKWFADGEYALFTFLLGHEFTESASFDISQVDAIRLAFRDNNGVAIQFSIQAIASFDQWAGDKKAIIMFDDGRRSVWEAAKAELDSRGMVASVAMPHDQVGNTAYLSLEELTTLRDSGWEIVGHATGNNQTEDTEAVVRTYIQEGVQYWIDNRFQVSGWVFAGGEYGPVSDNADKTVLEIVREEGYLWSRVINEANYETLPIADPSKIRPIYVTNVNTVAQITASIDEVYASGGMVMIVFHRLVDASPSATTEYLTTDFALILDHLASITGVTTARPTDVVRLANEIV